MCLCVFAGFIIEAMEEVCVCVCVFTARRTIYMRRGVKGNKESYGKTACVSCAACHGRLDSCLCVLLRVLSTSPFLRCKGVFVLNGVRVCVCV